MTVFARIDRWQDIPAAISRFQLAGAGHRVPLLRALYEGRIAHLELQRSGSAGLFKRWAAMIRLPGMVLLGDDDHAVNDGPDAWPIARRVLRWARFVLIHGGAGAPEHYELAIQLTKQHGRLVLVESASTRISDWEDAASRWCRAQRAWS
jgi:hypothetical protein